jgi:hypothetical protein
LSNPAKVESAQARVQSSQPQVVDDGDDDLLLGAKIAFCGLDGGVAEQELDLFEVAAVLAA